MRRLGKFLLFVALFVGAVVAAYKIAFPTYTHRYRLVVTIQIDDRSYTGSSVIQVRFIGQPSILEAPPFFPAVGGEAAVVELPGRRAIVATLFGSSSGFDPSVGATFLALRAFKLRGFEGYRQITRQTGRRELSPDNMPPLIWLSDIADPKTARRITTAHIPELLGAKARLASIYIEMTNDPVVIDIDRKLPWLKALRAAEKNGVISRPGEFKLIHGMFVGPDS
jgi:hypothetical protein